MTKSASRPHFVEYDRRDSVLNGCQNRDAPLMRLLASLARPALPNKDGTTPLMAAAGIGTYSPGEIRDGKRSAGGCEK